MAEEGSVSLPAFQIIIAFSDGEKIMLYPGMESGINELYVAGHMTEIIVTYRLAQQGRNLSNVIETRIPSALFYDFWGEQALEECLHQNQILDTPWLI